MSRLRPGDEDLHHSDGSHRWGGGPGDTAGHDVYIGRLRAHLERHAEGDTEIAAPTARLRERRDARR